MGFFSNIARGLIAGVRAFAGTPAVVAPTAIARATTAIAASARTAAAAAARAARTPAGQLAIAAGGGAIGGVLAQPGDLPVMAGAPTPPELLRGGLGGGNGVVARQTIVQTINLLTGQITRQERFAGAPFLMNSEVRSLRRVAKKVGRAHAKLPRRTVQKSAMKELTDAAVAEALRKVQQPCPPVKC